EVREAPALPQSMLVARNGDSAEGRGITGACALTSAGLGITPGAQFSLVQCSETPEELEMLSAWFSSMWESLPNHGAKEAFAQLLEDLSAHKPPSLIYHLILYHLFKDLGDELDEERIVKSGTGIRNTVVWKKLYKFQRDAVV